MVQRARLLAIVEQSRKSLMAFWAGLPMEERDAAGSYEQWSARDTVAHVAHWIEERALRLEDLVKGKDVASPPAHYEQANAQCFQRYCQSPWSEIEALASHSLDQVAAALKALSEEQLAVQVDGEGRPRWMDVVGTVYTHLLMHLAEYETKHARPLRAALLWQEWGVLVAPLDDSADWQGLVHYNQACGLALAGQKQPSLDELRQAIQLRPSLTAWSKQDPDLNALHDLPEFRELYAPEHWWRAIAAGPIADTLADQFLRAVTMVRLAIKAFPEEAWRKGDAPCERPAALTLHLLDSLDELSSLKPGEVSGAVRFGVNWDDKDVAKLPAQDGLLAYLDDVEVRLTDFLAGADWLAPERLFPWAGSNLLGRAVYNLRHVQHHLADLCSLLHNRGIKAPDWQ